jgi:hypothetical protein
VGQRFHPYVANAADEAAGYGLIFFDGKDLDGPEMVLETEY